LFNSLLGEVKSHHVYFDSTAARNPGVLGLKWPRFENRGPAVDALRPMDDEGRPLHVVRKGKEAFLSAQWELAVMNFRVIDRATGAKVAPDAASITRLKEIWESGKRKKKKEAVAPTEIGDVKVSEKVLARWEKEFAVRYKLIEGQQPLTPQTGAGRARYSSPTLRELQRIISGGQRVDPPQPVLRRTGETPDDALNRYLAEIKHPLVRHRLTLFRRLLTRLVSRFGKPDVIVLEAVRSLALAEKKRRELIKRIADNRKERAGIHDELKGARQSTSRNAILKYRLWKEAGSRCPFCCEAISQAQLFNGEADIEHLVPRAVVDCNEYYNLTVGHLVCNREVKGERTPFGAFGDKPIWPQLRDNAEARFKGRKLEIFLSDKAEELVEQKSDLQHTAYIARVIRHVALVQLNWLAEDGRDPTTEKGNTPSASFQVTNGQLTSRLRQSWGLNQILHPLPEGKRWNDLTEEEQRKFSEKNRGDLRHHALDALVICSTLPWLAHRTHGAKDEQGRHGWWTQDEKQRSKAANPIGLTHDLAKQLIEKVVVQHHVSRSPHQQAYATTLYAKKAPNTYVAREKVQDLKEKDFGDFWPKDLGIYFQAAWQRYGEEAADLKKELWITKDKLPDSFTRKLCFSHFQTWRADGAPPFAWPEKVKIPIRNVRLISVKDDSAVMAFSSGTHAFVKRTGFKEVQIHVAEDGKSFVPVFVPYWKGDRPLHEKPIKQGNGPVVVIRRGMIVETTRPFSTGQPPGLYRVLVTGQNQLRILPHHIANQEDAIIAFGLPKKGLQPYWPDFIRALGHELPHPPSAQS